MNTGSLDPRPTMSQRTFAASSILMAAASVAAVGASYLLSLLELDVRTKSIGFIVLTASFLLIFGSLYLLGRRRIVEVTAAVADHEKLDLLDEANEIFSGSLSTADAFRLAVSRIALIVPCQAAALWLPDRLRETLTCTEAVGELAGGLKGSSRNSGEGIVGMALEEREHQMKNDEGIGRSTLAEVSAAIPLLRGGQAAAVVQLFFAPASRPLHIPSDMLTGIGSRIAPLLLSSIALDLTRSSALTDAATDLPNERSFYLVLENQLFEAARKGSDRPLTVLAMDVKGFDDINSRFGGSAGDAVLNHVARTIKEDLRQMDFFARSARDEFLAILPTASTAMSAEVVARLRQGSFDKPVTLSEKDSMSIELNVGWASFGEDGETAAALVRTARVRRDQTGYSSGGRVLSFSKELVS